MQHTRTKTGGVIKWDTADWRAGLGAQGYFGSGAGVKQTDANGWLNLTNIDPFTRYGILSPGNAPNSFTNGNLLNGPVIASQIYNNNLMFGVSSGGTVHQMTYSGGTPSITTGSGGFPHTISDGHANYVGNDCLLYTHTYNSNKVLSLFYSYYDGTDFNVGADVGIVAGVGTFDDDFMSTIPATPLAAPYLAAGKGRPHPLCIGADGLLYIGSGNILHAYDGNDGTAYGTFSAAVLTFLQGFEIISIRKYNDSLLIAGNYSPSSTTATADGSGEALVYVWNYTDLNTTQVIPLEDPYVSAMFIYKGNATVITSGIQERNGTNKIKVITGISTTKIADFDGTIPINRGIVVADDVLYLNAGGKILSYGDKYIKSNAINNIGTCSVNTVSGFLAYNFSNSSLLASSNNGSTTSAVNDFVNAGTDNASMRGFWYQLDLPHGKRARVVSVEIQYFSLLAQNASNGQFSLLLETDFSLNDISVVLQASSVVSPLTKKFTYTSDATPVALPHFTSIAPRMIWTSSSVSGVPSVSTISIEYEDLDLSTNSVI